MELASWYVSLLSQDDLLRFHQLWKRNFISFTMRHKFCKSSFIFSIHRASYYEISVDDGPWEKQKSSGLNLCTGTGSKAWWVTWNVAYQLLWNTLSHIICVLSHTGVYLRPLIRRKEPGVDLSVGSVSVALIDWVLESSFDL